MSKIFFSNKPISLKKKAEKPQIIIIRKPINKIMNLSNFKKNSLKTTTKYTSIFFKRSYISPTVTSIKKNSMDKKSPSYSKLLPNNSLSKITHKCINSSFTPRNPKTFFLKKDISNKVLSNQKRNCMNITRNRPMNSLKIHNTEQKLTKENTKYRINIDLKLKQRNNNNNNYKNRIINNRQKLIKNIDNNYLLNSLLDKDNSEISDNKSLQGKDKLKHYLNEKNNKIIGFNIKKPNSRNKVCNILLSNNKIAKTELNKKINNNIYENKNNSPISRNGHIPVTEIDMREEEKNSELGKIIREKNDDKTQKESTKYSENIGNKSNNLTKNFENTKNKEKIKNNEENKASIQEKEKKIEKNIMINNSEDEEIKSTGEVVNDFIEDLFISSKKDIIKKIKNNINIKESEEAKSTGEIVNDFIDDIIISTKKEVINYNIEIEEDEEEKSTGEIVNGFIDWEVKLDE